MSWSHAGLRITRKYAVDPRASSGTSFKKNKIEVTTALPSSYSLRALFSAAIPFLFVGVGQESATPDGIAPVPCRAHRAGHAAAGD